MLAAKRLLPARRRRTWSASLALVTDAGGVEYTVREYTGKDAYGAIHHAEKAMRLESASLSVVQQLGMDVAKTPCLMDELTAVCIVPAKEIQASVDGVARSSPALCIILHNEVKLLYVLPRMRRRGIGKAIAKHIVDTTMEGATRFVVAPPCLTGAALSVWKSTGHPMVSSLHDAVHPLDSASPPSNKVAGIIVSFTRDGDDTRRSLRTPKRTPEGAQAKKNFGLGIPSGKRS